MWQVRKLVNAAYERARGILMNNRDELDALASELLDKESLTGAQVRPPCKLSIDKQKQARQPSQQLEFLGTSGSEPGAVGTRGSCAQCHSLCTGYLRMQNHPSCERSVWLMSSSLHLHGRGILVQLLIVALDICCRSRSCWQNCKPRSAAARTPAAAAAPASWQPRSRAALANGRRPRPQPRHGVACCSQLRTLISSQCTAV